MGLCAWFLYNTKLTNPCKVKLLQIAECPLLVSLLPPHSSTMLSLPVYRNSLLCTLLCGSVKKWSRGDKSWDSFKPRIQRGVSDLIKLVDMVSPVSLEVAMEKNIEKIKGRRERGVVKGDGNLR